LAQVDKEYKRMHQAASASLLGSHVVVFGGSTGIGLATAIVAKEKGANVTIVGRTPKKLRLAAMQIGEAQTLVADIADRKSVEAVFAGMQRVDHLVITAGGLMVGRLADSDPDDLLTAMQERIAGPLYAIKAALPYMPPSGSIVLTGGQLSDRPAGNGTSVIAAAVRAVEALARSLALELKPIRINVISPGFVETPLFDALGTEGRAQTLQHAARLLPGGRIGQADEIGAAIGFLMCNGYMNAEVLHIDGGGRFV
jgi:NAD(P)-dependent dehydrogenase (short-subunit alcohol dehydrogenase family)